MLVRSDPFRELDRFTQQVLGTAARPAVMPMDAWREGDDLVVEFDLPGIEEQSLDLDVERNVVTVRAQRPEVDPSRDMLATERPRGCSAASWYSAITSTPSGSKPPTAAVCCGCRSRWPKRPNPARSPLTTGIVSRPSTRARSSTRDRTAGDAHRRSIRAVSRHDGANGLRSPRGRSRSGVVCGGDRAVRGGRRHPMRRGIPVDPAVSTAGAPGERVCPFQVRVAGVRGGPVIGTVPATRVSPAPRGAGSLTQPSASSPDPAQNTKEVMTSQHPQASPPPGTHRRFTAHPGPPRPEWPDAAGPPQAHPGGWAGPPAGGEGTRRGIAGDYYLTITRRSRLQRRKEQPRRTET